MSRRPRVLFVSEAITLAQVVRLASLAGRIDPRRYEVHFAASRFSPLVFDGLTVVRHPIYSLPEATVEAAVTAGRRPYDERTLVRYAEDDLRLLDAVSPDVVVGDFRLSLGTSAALRGVPYAALANAYWSPYAVRSGFPMPDHPLVRVLGPRVAARYFPYALPRVFAHFAAPVNALRRRYGLPPVGSLPQVLTHGDVTLYADPASLVQVRELPASHRFIGPVLWSPPVAAPRWFEELPADRACIYVTLGSSGKADLLPVVLEALADLDATVIAATAGRSRAVSPPPNARIATFVPGDAVARRASLVISNGGSSTGYQALAAGTPVLGLPWNLDQYLASSCIEGSGAGRALRAGSATVDAIRELAAEMLGSKSARLAADAVKKTIDRESPHRAIEELLAGLRKPGGNHHVA